MGSLLQTAVLPSSVPDDPDSAYEIGAVVKQQGSTACRVGLGINDELVFLKEVPIRVSWDIKEEFLSDGTSWRWWRYEAKVDPRGEGRGVRSGQSLVVAEYPYSISRIHQGLFKSGSHKGPERISLARRFSTGKELLKEVEGLRVDYWETGNLLTAGLSNPEMSFRPDRNARRYHKDALYVLGICENFAEVEKKLYATQYAQDLLRMTRNRKIIFTHGTVNPPPRLYQEVADQGEALLLVSIRQALAGPHTDPDRWTRKPIMKLVDRIYRDHLNACNRRVRGRNEISEDSDF
jgi:hypothetical protein